MQLVSNAAKTTPSEPLQPEFNPAYQSLLLAVDSSDHSNRATEDAIEIANLYSSRVTASHVYAAQMHDLRFRQMEGGLPEQFKEEQELERQRDIHDSLITKGLSIITDSYLIQAQQACHTHSLEFRGRSLEGKNYKMLADEANSNHYDLLVMGALGLGAMPGSSIGTVCERVCRRNLIDTLIIKDPSREIKSGPIVVAVDGSKQSYAALLTGFELAIQWSVPLHVVSAFDPYYHYVAFNRIANVLSEEAGKVFRFKEQEQLHEEIIDDGLAKIYQGHLEVAEKMAAHMNAQSKQKLKMQTHLLTGKPHHAIQAFLEEKQPSLLLLGKTGIHADEALDIGGNTENLLRNSPCALLITTRQYTPLTEVIAETTTSWSTQAEAELEKIPPFVQNMARAAILRYAQQEGHTVITANIVQQATQSLCPMGHQADKSQAQPPSNKVSSSDNDTQQKGQAFAMPWSDRARDILADVADPGLRHNTQMRAEKKALHLQASQVEEVHILPFVVNPKIKQQQTKLKSAEPSSQTSDNKSTIKSDSKSASVSKCPFAHLSQANTESQNLQNHPLLTWTPEALKRLEQIPQGTSRDMTRKATETIANQQGHNSIDLIFLEQILNIFSSASQHVEKQMNWEAEAEQAISKAPPMVQGMLIKEIETEATRQEMQMVSLSLVKQIKGQWNQGEVFHLAPNDPRNSV